MASVKIACIGAGSMYFRRALADIAVNPGLSESEITLYDLDLDKATVMADHAARLTDACGTRQRARAVASLTEAVDGASFVLTSIGGAGVSTGRVYGTAPHAQDILIPARYGVYQIVGDTGGPAGMMMGLRSIRAYLDICHEMEKRCPNAVLLNHSNPMAVLCRAMAKYSNIKVVGICHGVQGGIVNVAKVLEVDPHEVDTVWIGTNHYYWFTRICHEGRDVYPLVRERMAAREAPEGDRMSSMLSSIYGYQIVYPHDSHVLEFYPFLSQVRSVGEIPYGFDKRATEQYAELEESLQASGAQGDPDAARKADLDAIAADLAKVEPPSEPSSPITGEGIGVLMDAIASGRRQVHIVNIPNRGSVPNLPDYALLEVEGVTDSTGLRGVYMDEAPISLMGILQKRIAWQELVADAGAKGDRNLALQALLLDEMAIPPEQASEMLDELLAASKDYLPQFS